jgi:tRNA1Val (adenine37-N6)-methyltransferase
MPAGIIKFAEMSNPYFQFKQFRIQQDRCAMKVCTDACVLGAWFAEKISSPSKVLDLGSGTGLLMLMMAQKNSGEIHGIELDQNAYAQGEENIKQTKWNERLTLFSGDARTFSFPVKYDFIITNPPFYEGDLIAATGPENLARHSQELTLAALLDIIESNLTPAGSFGILLPYRRMDYFEKLAASRQFYLLDPLQVRQTPGHEPFRAILHFSRMQGKEAPSTTLIIKDQAGQYTEDFVQLLKDYYLYL